MIMNNKGYTLVELIAMVVVIGVLMVIAVPNIAGILQKSKQEFVTEDIHRMVSNAKQKLETEKVKYPDSNGRCTVLTLKFINSNDDFTEGANGGKFDMDNSYVVIKKEAINSTSSVYKYYIRLVEEKDGETYLLDFVDYDEFVKDPENYALNKTNEEIPELDSTIEIKYDDIRDHINNIAGYNLCNHVMDYN